MDLVKHKQPITEQQRPMYVMDHKRPLEFFPLTGTVNEFSQSYESNDA